MLLADGTTVMEFVANKVPSTIDVFTQMLDKSIIIDEKECGLVSIFTQTKLGRVSTCTTNQDDDGVMHACDVFFFKCLPKLSQVRLDFRRVFRNTWNSRSGQRDMDFFFGLMKSPMKTCLEHPLLWAFLNMKLVQVEMILRGHTCDDIVA